MEPPRPLSAPCTGEGLHDWLATVSLLMGTRYGRGELAADLGRLGCTVTVRTVSTLLRYGGELPVHLVHGLATLSLFVTVTGHRPPARDGNTSDGINRASGA